jgi:hypothetical protein
MMTAGAKVVGDLPRCHVFRNAKEGAAMDIKHFMNTARDWHDTLVALPPPKTETMTVVFEKSKKEQELGILGDWHPREFFDDRRREGVACP